VDPLPVAVFSTIQTGLELEFLNGSLDADEFFWDFGDGNISTEMHPIHTYSDFGTYTILLIAENSCGSNTMTITLELSGAPVPVFEAEQTNGCIPFEVKFIDLSQNDPALWEWSFPGGSPDTSNMQNPVILYDQPGVYRVTLRVSNAGGAQAMQRDEFIHVAFSAEAEFNASPDGPVVTFSNLSQEATQYFWFFGDGMVDTAANPVHVYEVSGTYQVQLIASNVCSSDTMTLDVMVSVTSVDSPDEEISINLFPNPNAGVFTIHLANTEDEFDIEVYDFLGRRVLSSEISPNGSGRHELTLSDATAGIYTVILRKQDLEYVRKMVVVTQ